MAFVKVGHIKERSSGNPAGGLHEAIKYILNPEKTEGKTLVGSYMLSLGLNPERYEQDAFNAMIDIKKAFSNGTGSPNTDTLHGRQGYHFILSFPADDSVTPELALQITNDFCEKYLSEYQCIYAAHTNTDHLHTHIVFNSISCFTGLKYHYAKGEWKTNIQPIANELCEKYGLQSLSLEMKDNSIYVHKKSHNYGKWVKDREGSGEVFKREKAVYYTNSMIKRDIDEAINRSSDYLSFVQILEDKGYKVDDSGKHLKLLAPGRQRYCRTYSLSDDKSEYNKQGIIDRINGVFMDRSDVINKLFTEWREYIATEDYQKLKKRTNLSIAQANEELNLALRRGLWSQEDVDKYKAYLNMADKQLNIIRKRINTVLEEHGEYIDKLRSVVTLKKYYDRYNEGIEFFKEDADKFMSEYLDIKQSGYNLKYLYNLDKYGNRMIQIINDYKKHLYVEKKICERIEKKLAAPDIKKEIDGVKKV